MMPKYCCRTCQFIRRFPTIDDYMEFHRAAGHVCCNCPDQTPPLPCCNPGHVEAEQMKEKFRVIVEGSEDEQ